MGQGCFPNPPMRLSAFIKKTNAQNESTTNKRNHHKKFYGAWFLCHPLAGDSEEAIKANLKKAAELARKLALENPDAVIFSPIAACSFMKEPEDRELALKYCEYYLASGQFIGIILPPGWTESRGCIREFEMAVRMNLGKVFLNRAGDRVNA